MTNGLLTAERRSRIGLADARRFVRLLLSLPIVIDPVSRRRGLEATHALARRYDLTSYDAAHLKLAVRLGVPLATLDGPLRDAASAEGAGVFRNA